MKTTTLLVLGILLLLCLAACAGSENDNLDKIPPIPPVMVPHLGDTGDDPAVWNNLTLILNEENNGIDAVPDGDWIRVQWDPFKDSDLSHVKIWRFSDFQPEPVMVDSISASAKYYLDVDSDLTERVWYHYFIDLVDLAGNSSRSDTSSYALLSKSMLVYPQNNATIPHTNAEFKWDSTGIASKYRLMIFDENNNHLYHEDLYAAMDSLYIKLPVNLGITNSSVLWRVDSFDWDQEKLMYMGSESHQRVVHIQ
ncbi:MAG: hypothetical protein K0B87_05665 [Candidatus Syntrophosphaera sp.]|nr:hypothetical protein [Candidatus Syntrophosphaera sp.]